MMNKTRDWRCLIYFVASTVVVTAPIVGCEPNSYLRQRGMEALQAGDVRWADERFSKAIHQDPTDWKSQFYLGRIRLRQGQPMEAQLHLEQALALRGHHPETGDLIDHLAEALFQQGETAKLHALVKQAAIDHGSTRDYLRQAKYLAYTGDADGAKLAYRKAGQFAAADDPDPFLHMADFYESIGDRGNALTALRCAYGIKPGSRELRNRLRKHGVVPGPTVALPREMQP